MENERKTEEIKGVCKFRDNKEKGGRGQATKLKAQVDKAMKRMMRAVGKAKVDKEEIASITRKEGGRRC